MNTYGVLGTGTASPKVITAGLDDLPSKKSLYVPWYGKALDGLSVVYDFLLDNEVPFALVTAQGVKVPKILTEAADQVLEVKIIDEYIIETLKFSDNPTALLLWDNETPALSGHLAEKCIDAGVKALELTNGLVPIVFDEEPAPQVPATAEEVQEEEDPTEEFDLPTLENMPAAVVKRMAKDKGHDVKTKDEAISALLGTPLTDQLQKDREQKPSSERHIVSVTVRYSDGMVMEL